MATDNMTLGRFELVGIPPAPRGVPQIEVTFALDTDGVANVSAKDLGTGRSQSIVVTASSGLSEQEVERLVEEAAAHADDDSSLRALIELRNKANGLIYSTEKTLEEFAEDVEADDRDVIEVALGVAREKVKEDDPRELRTAIEELSGLTYQMTEKLYAALGAAEAESDAEEA
jgi:molecular chaperone DnaK